MLVISTPVQIKPTTGKFEEVDFSKLYTDRKMEVAYPKARLGRTTEEFARRIAKLSLTSTPMDDP